MSKRTLAMAVALAMFSFGVTAPCKAGTFISTVALDAPVSTTLTQADVYFNPGSSYVPGSVGDFSFSNAVNPVPTVYTNVLYGPTGGLYGLVFFFQGSGLMTTGSTQFTGTSWSYNSQFVAGNTGATGDSFSSQAVPEPGSMALLGIGMIGLVASSRFLKRGRA